MTSVGTTTPASLRDALFSRARAYGQRALLTLPDGSVADLRTGYIPLLVNFSFEDKAAKGLRKLKDQSEPEPAVYFSALEMVRDHASLVLTAETGGGKTSFAQHLALALAGERLVPLPVARNEFGAVHEEHWDLDHVLPLYVAIKPGVDVRELLDEVLPGLDTLLSSEAWVASDATLLVMLDGIEAAGDQGPVLLEQALAFQARFPRVRLLALGEQAAVKSWALPPALARYDLLPLSRVQRLEAGKRLAGLDLEQERAALGAAAGNPAQFVMALHGHDEGDTAEAITDRWLAKLAGDTQTANFLCGLAFDALSGTLDEAGLFPVTRVRQLLAARHLSTLPAATAVQAFRSRPTLWMPVLQSLARRLKGSEAADTLIEALIAGDGDDARRGALLAAGLGTQAGPSRDRIAVHLLDIVGYGALSIPERESAGRILSAWGDPRDLEALAQVPAGVCVLGSDTHPNSAPPQAVEVGAFRIGLYPVTNSAYAAFSRDTGRLWRSPDGLAEDRRNAPATDLTWRDARAYCDWLTDRWRAQGKIGPDDIVRLPTEPEWERAARGDQPDLGAETIVYPWGRQWIADAANSEEAGLNNTCTVGLFPKGRSAFGCYDMTGQVWEWCTTLWGEDMATPSFRYPYGDDGREADDAGPAVRRVLRGGCFSSNKMKACCTYRGSLEPDGFWRGNGFRVVVS
ncbi:formylglycine-generating enzyme family protein (plasmid) [Rhizobium grahamii]|uniref:Formylglycine-generating enzyme family protein n=1 Tax=Rhizobium grahamii TaxID=1120045 RepID=A0A5Q0CEJ8_9HYPH|nr:MULTISPECIES: SUMF1/EgtB/PvdO family nonheme iron enzyme [Rhizobium]QFY63725.1 formylglycine-generating enzyme family protein [Rhizobium grahamii]QRM51512.1 formylglycine-generating enzyme family protein [Rhizobium sp. BG6]